MGLKQDLIDAKIQEGNQNNRKSAVSWIKDKWIENTLSSTIKMCNKTWNFDLKEYEPFQYTVYKKNDFYDWHIDTHNKPYSNGFIRKLSFTLLLNDDYEGGSMAFFNKEVQIRAGAGSVILFPANFMYPHQIMDVTEGTRYSIVTWFT